MKKISFKWREESGRYSLAVTYPQAFPFQIEEIEQIAAGLGFQIEAAGSRKLGDLSGEWTPPESAEAIPAMRNALAALGYSTLFEGEEDE